MEAAFRPLAGAFALAVLAAQATAGGARIVRSAGGAEFDQISTAVHAALPGDVILVGHGEYQGFTLEGKAVSIVGAPGATVTIVSSVVVRDVPAGGVVLLDNLRFVPETSYAKDPFTLAETPALHVIDCAASLRIQDCRLETTLMPAQCQQQTQSAWIRRDSALRVEGCPDVAVVGSELVTGDAGGGWGECSTADGAPGADLIDSNVAFHGDVVRGGKGGTSGTTSLPHGDGGAGIQARSSSVFVGACEVAGASSFHGPAFAGSAVQLDPGSTLTVLDSSLTPAGTAPAIGGAGSATLLPDAARSLQVQSVAVGGTQVQAIVTGVSQDAVWTAIAQGGGWRLAQALAGVWLTKFPAFVPFASNGVVDPVGVLAFELPMASPKGTARLLDVQSITSSFVDGSVVTNVRVVLVLSPTLGPDCDGNGTSDYVDVLLGGAPDADRDLVPDVCPAPPPKTVHVDAAAAPGGDGSSQAPFVNLAQASGAASQGDTILLADGLYTGPANREFAFHGRHLTIEGMHGADACIVDFEEQGIGFEVAGGGGLAPVSSSRLVGLTLRNPAQLGSSLFPKAGVVVQGGPLEIEGCRFESGGSPIVSLESPGPLTIRDTVFTGSADGILVGMTTTIEDCRFTGLGDECILAPWAAGPLRIARSRFEGNDGALLVSTSPAAPLIVENCLFQTNAGLNSLAAIDVQGGNTWIDACTFVDNYDCSHDYGLIVRAPTTGPVLLSNSILRGSVCTPDCARLIWVHTNLAYPLTVRSSNVAGGQQGLCDTWNQTIWDATNQSADPLFVDPDGPDNDPLTFADNDYRLAPGSPCIDAGDNSLAQGLLDLDGMPRFVDDPAVPDTGIGTPPLCDMGCYEKP